MKQVKATSRIGSQFLTDINKSVCSTDNMITPNQINLPQKMHILACTLFLASLLAAISSCQYKAPPTQVTTADSSEVAIPLSPLEVGDVYLKDLNPFGNDVLIASEHVVEPDTFKPSETKLTQSGNLLFMKTLGGPYYVFKYPELTYVRTLGVKGNGSDEFVFPDLVTSHDTTVCCYLFELTKEKLYKVNSSLQVIPIDFAFHSSIEFASGKEGNLINIAPDDFIFADRGKSGKAIYRIQKQNDSIVTRQLYDLTLFSNRKSPFAYTGFLGVNVKQNRMVYAYKYFKILKFMDLEGKTVRTLNYQQKEFNDQSLTIYGGQNE